MTLFPILLLQIKSILCPCFLSSAERDAWTALRHFQGLRILWKPLPVSTDRTTMKTVTDKITGFLNHWKKEGNVMDNRITDKDHQSLGALQSEATCLIVDSYADDGPCLCIRFLNNTKNNDNDSTSSNSRSHSSNSTNPTVHHQDIRIPLASMGRIHPYSIYDADASEGIMIYTRGQQEDVLLCQFQLISHESRNEHLSSEEVIQYLKMILQWIQEPLSIVDMNGSTSTSNDTYSHSGGGNPLTSHAMKIKHFATREIELQKTKREREERKQKYMKESGGLKYTALAMANRHHEIT